MDNKNKKGKVVIITGINGQTGSYLAEILVDMMKIGEVSEVHGIIRRSSTSSTPNIDGIFNELNLHYGDMTDPLSLFEIIKKVNPDWVFHLAAQSHVAVSFVNPGYTFDANAKGTLNLLEVIRQVNPNIKMYSALTSETFGGAKESVPEKGYNEDSKLYPRSPYGVSKQAQYSLGVNYRDSYNMFISHGFLFNHFSPRRGINFFSKKCIRALSKIKYNKQDVLTVGNIDSYRDWGYAKDYAKAMILMLQQDKSGDYVISSGETHSGRELIEISCKILGIDLEWQGTGVDEVGIDKNTGKTIIKIDPKYFRPAEVDYLLGDCSKAKRELGWKNETSFEDLIKIMVDYEVKEIEKTLN